MKRLLFVSCLSLTACHAATAASPEPQTAAVDPMPQAPSVVEVKRVVVSMGRVSGSSVARFAPDGTVSTVLDVLENGRGPHCEASFTLSRDGTITKFEAKGHHTFGATYTNQFKVEGDTARWQSPEETGEKKLTGPAFYVPLAEVGELEGLLVQAALKRGGRIPVLPAGEVRVEKTGTFDITFKGEKKTLTGYDIHGLGFEPSHTWMNADGSWFGSASEWFSLVPEGAESAIEPLVAHQRELDRARAAALFRELAHVPPAQGIAYSHARVLDVERGKWLSDQTVLVVGDTIAWIKPSSGAKVPEGVEVVDLAGRALMPGLWDMHAHFGDSDGLLNLASGVTTARDVGNDPDKLDDYKARFDGGTAIGPHILRFGFIEGRNEKAASSKVTAETPDEAKAAVQFFVDRKYEGVKIYNSVKPELVPVIAAEAHAKGLKVTGHIPVHMLANEAVKAGYDGIEHINMLFLNFFATHETDTRDTTRFTLVGDKAADFDLASKPVKDFIALLKQKKTVIDPTVNAFEDLLVAQQGKITPGLETTVARLPVNVQRAYLMGGLPMGEKAELYKRSYDKMLAMIKALVDAKVPVVLGTDAIAGVMFHHEMALFSRAGISNAAILRMATLDAARTLGLEQKTGSIAKGKAADLVVIDGDPLANIDDAQRVVSVMRGGIVFDGPSLLRAVSVQAMPAR